MKTTFLLILLSPLLSCAQTPGLEFHASVNYPLGGDAFPGAGIATNIIFRENNLVNFKTGLEINYFHTREEQSYGGSKGDCQYGVFSVPAMVRFTFGDKFKVVVESGIYLGIGYGQIEAPKNYKGLYGVSLAPNVKRYESYFPGVVITPAIGLGGRFPLSERIDLFLKPEFALTVTQFDVQEMSFETWYYYARFCAGIHLKPKPRKTTTKNGVIKIEPLHP